MCNTVEQCIIIFIHAFKVSIFCFIFNIYLFKFVLCSLIPTFTMVCFRNSAKIFIDSRDAQSTSWAHLLQRQEP